ncbi:excalibur calcium-binding domain-containing protein [Sphingomonas sp. S1-29]|uniref:excalibur calcium-binding domain-containing protein n=1 Tax=Sphingomonas sp. S1-29 TaxID=2991074 RepID=UPI00223FEA98|nr:excalibur calcium-binding domain-containing protein [Sphingomonas sp. S1-29]UZK71095.1 excalibur calcium-binding domain-containing protein [Sphingomonas sp. S1-29]
MIKLLSAAIALIVPVSASVASPGGLNAQGCHTDRKGGTGYHCHTRPAAAHGFAALTKGSGAFANCAAARAAGAAPVRVGDPGYSSHLDRNGDGIGCE